MVGRGPHKPEAWVRIPLAHYRQMLLIFCLFFIKHLIKKLFTFFKYCIIIKK